MAQVCDPFQQAHGTSSIPGLGVPSNPRRSRGLEESAPESGNRRGATAGTRPPDPEKPGMECARPVGHGAATLAKGERCRRPRAGRRRFPGRTPIRRRPRGSGSRRERRRACRTGRHGHGHPRTRTGTRAPSEWRGTFRRRRSDRLPAGGRANRGRGGIIVRTAVPARPRAPSPRSVPTWRPADASPRTRPGTRTPARSAPAPLPVVGSRNRAP